MGVIQGDTRSVDYGSHPIIVLRPSTRLGGIIARCVHLYDTFPKGWEHNIKSTCYKSIMGTPQKGPPPPRIFGKPTYTWMGYIQLPSTPGSHAEFEAHLSPQSRKTKSSAFEGQT